MFSRLLQSYNQPSQPIQPNPTSQPANEAPNHPSTHPPIHPPTPPSHEPSNRKPAPFRRTEGDHPPQRLAAPPPRGATAEAPPAAADAAPGGGPQAGPARLRTHLRTLTHLGTRNTCSNRLKVLNPRAQTLGRYCHI